MHFNKKTISLLLALLLFVFSSRQQQKIIPALNSNLSPTFPIKSEKQTAKITRVIDGDTVELETGQKVRYIGVDTPELHDPRKPVQCFGQEAMLKNKELVEGRVVKLEKDVSETDKYGRLLRYVYLDSTATSSGIFINDYLVKEGFARIDTVPPDVKFADLFLQSQKEAMENNRGLWSKCR